MVSLFVDEKLKHRPVRELPGHRADKGAEAEPPTAGPAQPGRPGTGPRCSAEGPLCRPHPRGLSSKPCPAGGGHCSLSPLRIEKPVGKVKDSPEHIPPAGGSAWIRTPSSRRQPLREKASGSRLPDWSKESWTQCLLCPCLQKGRCPAWGPVWEELSSRCEIRPLDGPQLGTWRLCLRETGSGRVSDSEGSS